MEGGNGRFGAEIGVVETFRGALGFSLGENRLLYLYKK
jgi:hypothetical protein